MPEHRPHWLGYAMMVRQKAVSGGLGSSACWVDVAKGVGKLRETAAVVAALRIPVMAETHDVAQFVYERRGGVSIDHTKGKRFGACRRDDQLVRPAGTPGDYQQHDVCGNRIANVVDLVHVSVRHRAQTSDIYDQIVGLPVPYHLFGRHQVDALVHATRLVGRVGLRDHEVDLGRDFVRPTHVLPGRPTCRRPPRR